MAVTTPRAICVLGMHRSGTSVAMRALNLLGVYLGEDSDLFGPTLDNRKGVWERQDVVALHDELLDRLKGGWQRCLHLDGEWHRSAEVKPFRGRLMALVRDHFGKLPLWGWKDPRTCVLLPLWLDVLGELGVSVSAVHVVRNPLDVARSLHKRNGLPYEKSFGLWFFYNVTALWAGRRVIRHVLSYDRLVGEWKSELRDCAASLALNWRDHQSRLEQEMGTFLRPELRHSKSGREELTAEGVPGPVITLVDLLEAAVERGQVTDASLFEGAAEIYQQFRSYSSFFRYDLVKLWDRERELAQLRRELEEVGKREGAPSGKGRGTFGRIRTACSAGNEGGFLKGVLSRMRRAVVGGTLGRSGHSLAFGDAYVAWIATHEPDAGDLTSQRAESRLWPYRPRVSIVVPVYDPGRGALIRCIESVLQQTYEHWELCLADGGSIHGYVKEVIQGYARRDPRIVYVPLLENRGIAGNTNEALRAASGDYVGFLDHDDVLSPFALYEVVRLLNKDPSIDCIYSDEDKLLASSEQRYDPVFKPMWSPDTFLSYNYLCHFAVLRRVLLDDVGALREGFDGAQDYDLLLRVTRATNRIAHIPRVLYHWRASEGSTAGNLLAKPYAPDAAKRAIGDFLRERQLDAQVVDGKFPTSYRVKYAIKGNPKVSIIIPTRDKAVLLQRCVSSILSKTDYPDFEIVIVDNGSEEQTTRDYLRAVSDDGKARVIAYDRPFSFSAINNFAVRSVKSNFLVFLNNDTEVIGSEWLSAMLEFAQREDVGAVGAKLYYPDDTVQHGGVVVGLRGVADHAHRGLPRSSDGYIGRLNVIQNVSAVTGACLMTRRDVFEEVGGFEERLAYCFNDVDLCLKIRQRGYLIVWTPYAELYHHESASGGSKGYDATPEGRDRNLREADFMREKWRDVLEAGDPYYNPNLTLDRYDFGLRV